LEIKRETFFTYSGSEIVAVFIIDLATKFDITLESIYSPNITTIAIIICTINLITGLEISLINQNQASFHHLTIVSVACEVGKFVAAIYKKN
jgi:hypothetical protein